MAEYNVLAERWIPVEDLAGRQYELGLKDTLLQAHLLRRIIDPSPLITYGIQRMLIAFLMDALRPKHIEDLAALLARGRFDSATIEEYVALCNQDGERFDLFSAERPFLQSRFDGRWDGEDKIRPVALLQHEIPSGNNHIHFDHRQQASVSLTPAQCARALCAVNIFCTAGLQGPSSINGAPPIFVLHNGRNLHETLAGSMAAMREVESIPYDDPPVAWRGDTVVEPDKGVASTSLLYGMTWQARRILLIPEKDGLVHDMYFQKGLKFEGFLTWQDPHVAYVIGKNGRTSVKPHEGRAPWRDIGSLLLPGNCDATSLAPAIVSHYCPAREAIDDHASLACVSVFGLITNQAQYNSWYFGEIELEKRILSNTDLSALARDAVHLAEETARTLRKTLYFAVGRDVEAEVREQATASFFQATRDEFFGVFCPAAAELGSDAPDWNFAVLRNWKSRLYGFGMSAFSSACQRLGSKAQYLERQAGAERFVIRTLNKLLREGEKVDR